MFFYSDYIQQRGIARKCFPILLTQVFKWLETYNIYELLRYIYSYMQKKKKTMPNAQSNLIYLQNKLNSTVKGQ